MQWTPSHMPWMQQLVILFYLLPPIFIAMMALALVAPRFHKSKRSSNAQDESPSRAAGPSFKTAHASHPDASHKHAKRATAATTG